ncbi:EthD family reductase [Hyphomicrobium sp.]|uniref:EthD family reductase n=1 Tax=Hyphomicrobium sp. TaxID=82 RepID=UPI001E1335CC|nr:EthD family reductase [Hyphomicrobium sp.]MBY0558685.1 EthD family reductase [Hyphomicrobium sp.]
MIRLTVIYGVPTDAAKFDAYYRDVHAPLAAKMPLLKDFRYSRGAVTSSDDAKPVHLVAFLDYASKADLEASLNSEAGKAAVADVANFANGGVTILTTDI